MNITTQIVEMSQFPNKPWEGREGSKLWFIDGFFKDGRKFSKAVNDETRAHETHDALTKLIGQEDQVFEVEETDREFKGQRQLKLKSYPGSVQPQSRFGGGGGGSRGFGGPPQYRNTEQGVKEERDSIVRQTALKAAVDFLSDDADADAEGVLSCASSFYSWLTIAPNIPQPSKPVSASDDGAYTKHLNEIAAAVKAASNSRLDTLTSMISGSLDKGSITLDQASHLNDEMVSAKKALASSKELNNWVARKQQESRQNEPRHHDPQMNSTMRQAETVF